MILTTHALAGAVIGKNIESPWIIISVSLIFHYVLDTIKHGEYVETFDSKVAFKNTWWKVMIDLFGAGVITAIAIYFGKFDLNIVINILLGVFFSMLPDGVTLIYWKTRWKLFEYPYQFHSWIHRLPRFSPEREWNFKNEIYEVIIFLAIFTLLFF